MFLFIYLFFCLSIVNTQYYISFGCTVWWYDKLEHDPSSLKGQLPLHWTLHPPPIHSIYLLPSPLATYSLFSGFTCLFLLYVCWCVCFCFLRSHIWQKSYHSCLSRSFSVWLTSLTGFLCCYEDQLEYRFLFTVDMLSPGKLMTLWDRQFCKSCSSTDQSLFS